MIVKRTITKDDISEMPKVTFEGKIIMICTEKDAERAIEFLNKYAVLGIDSETKPSFVKGKSHKVSLLQVATDTHCFLFRLNLIGFPKVLIDLLENPSIVKVGLSLKDDFMMLHKRAPFNQQACIELQEYVRPFGIQDKSLQKIYGILFSEKISKSQQQILKQLSFFDQNYLHPSILANLAQTYVETAGQINPRILVRGNAEAFKDSQHTNRIRASLFTGLQMAHLWRQLGGSSLQLIFGKRKHLQEIQALAHMQYQLGQL